MVDIRDLYPGCKVRIVNQWAPSCHQAPSGDMDRWLGSVMTVQEITSKGYVIMEEDTGDGPLTRTDTGAGFRRPSRRSWSISLRLTI